MINVIQGIYLKRVLLACSAPDCNKYLDSDLTAATVALSLCLTVSQCLHVIIEYITPHH